MIERMTVISGGQTGVDQAALRAAISCGLRTGGYAPKGWLTEDGPAHWLADYGLVECPDPGYAARTHANVLRADATLLLVCGIIGYGSRGSRLVSGLACAAGKTLIVVDLDRQPDAAATAHRIAVEAALPPVLNVAGNRESGNPGIGAKAGRFLIDLFTILGGGS